MIRTNLVVLAAVALVTMASAALGGYTPGFIWNRQVSWNGGSGNGIAGNPNLDAQGNSAWLYTARGGGGLGSPSPWYAAPSYSVLGSFAAGGGTGWAGGDAIAYQTQFYHQHGGPAIPGVDWLNPVGQPVTVAVSGLLSFQWDQGATQPIEYAIAKRNVGSGQTTLLYSTVVTSGCPVPQTLSLPSIVLASNDSLVFTYRALNGSVGLYTLIDSVNITLVAVPAPPAITQQPAPASVFPSATATFSVAASSTIPLTYQWRRNGVNLANAPTGTGSVITGVDSPTMTISNASYADNGSAFDCVVSNASGSKQSNPAGLAVGPTCRADFNGSGTLSVQDIFDYLQAWFAGCP